MCFRPFAFSWLLKAYCRRCFNARRRRVELWTTQNAYAEAERFKEEAKGEKGVTGGNTARALLFWPAIVGTYMNSNEAIQAADSRKVHLINIMRDKDCSGLDSLG